MMEISEVEAYSFGAFACIFYRRVAAFFYVFHVESPMPVNIE
jgi:hypothetical protein